MATEAQGEAAAHGAEGGLAFHPMDQFIVKPLFQAYDNVVALGEPGSGGEGLTGLTESGHEVALTAKQALEVEAGGSVAINLFEAGIQQVHWYTITNVTLWMAITVLAIVVLLILGTSKRATIPNRTQSVAELAYGFVYKMIEDVTGKDGIKYFPYVMTLFMFIVFANFLGLLPMAFTTTSHIAVTAVLAFAVFFTVTILGFVKNGAHFLELFWVKSAPLALRPVLAIIELISYFVRPVSHSVRLAGNMMAGHAVIKVFAGFAAIAAIAPLSVVAVAAMYGLEVLVSFIQAYVFTILTCVYLKDALHPSH
ncbi:F0F1 ATP synthase subunit A [Pseudooceanicola sp.]|uniref:F0F1 ATP synthase subunit A n=1 Tax=Pseudooceanicola sp. TaxID=1914328 RepID=UPI00261F575D|nr:F0F1 ATP synthase subunit A [Pseudooceanicola sp.]MDF1856709.1 F0F1 ATP synthase subunit A [Pseudooceanicola sp.]